MSITHERVPPASIPGVGAIPGAVVVESAWLYVMEFFAWRQFRNRRQIGGLAGLTDTHYQSGDLQHQQGISKAGNRWVRALAINTAWTWLPASSEKNTDKRR